MIAGFANHLWQSTWFAVAAGVLTLAFLKSRAQVRYWLWLSASLKFLVPFALLITLGSQMERTPATAKNAAVPAASYTVVQISEPFPASLPPAPVRPRTTDWRSITIFAVWACGVAAIALIRLHGWRRIRAAVRASTPLDIPAAAAVEVRSAPGLLEPGVVGLLHPVLLLPAGIMRSLTARELDAVLAHELCHVRRRDNLTSAIHMIVEAAFWFHPLVWWISARLVDERERACDEEVLSLGNEPLIYAEGILNVCKTYLESPLSCVSGVTGSDLKKRIQAILTGSVAADLNLARKAVLAAVAIVALAAPIIIGIVAAPVWMERARAQSASETPKWEVASIRPCPAGEGGRGGTKKSGGAPNNQSPGRLTMNCMPLEGLIQAAYVRFQNGHFTLGRIVPIEGGPAWVRSERYQINAKAEAASKQDAPKQEMLRGPMLQALLEDRFKLKIRRETREVPVYELTVAKGSPKLQPSQPGGCIPWDFEHPLPPAGPGQPLPRGCGMLRGTKDGFDIYGATMAEFCKQLSGFLDRDVIDKTGVTGKFDLHVDGDIRELFALARPPRPDDPAVVPNPIDADGPGIFTALKQQLGLKLGPGKGPGQFLVIDHVEKPTPN